MSRKKIIAVKPIGVEDGWIPNTFCIIEMKGGSQVAEDNGKHNLENDLVRAYRKNETYDLGYVVGTGATKLLPYYDLSSMHYSDSNKQLHGIWEEKPRPVIISGTTEGNVLTVTSDSFSCSVPCENGTTKVYNLVPNETYTWVETNTSRRGTFATEGTVRQLYVDALPNFRDIGGYKCYADDGTTLEGTLEYGKIFRGFGYIPMMNKVSGGVQYTNIDWKNRSTWNSTYPDYSKRVEDIFTNLRALGIVKELDLRAYNTTYSPVSKDIYASGKAVGYARDPQYDGVENWYNHFEIGSYGNASEAGIFSTSATFTHDSSTSGKVSSLQDLYNCLNLIVDTIPEGGIWYHCKTGADRTGVLTAIIMAACGCSIDDIVKEYELTSFCRAGGQPNLTTDYSGKTSVSLRTLIKNNVKYTSASSGTFWQKILARVSNEAMRTKLKVLGEVLKTQFMKPLQQVTSQYDYGKKMPFVSKKFQPSTSQLAIWTHYSEESYDRYWFCEVSAKVGDIITVVIETNHLTFFIEAESSLLDKFNRDANIKSGFLVDEGQEEFTQEKQSSGVYTYTVKHTTAKVLIAIDTYAYGTTPLGIGKRYVVVSEG